jgi:hypothetical protein
MKKALLVGINNYPGTSNDLMGCVNDVQNMQNLLVSMFGFAAQDITMLTDREATTANILRGLEALVANTHPGDLLIFHYIVSGFTGVMASFLVRCLDLSPFLQSFVIGMSGFTGPAALSAFTTLNKREHTHIYKPIFDWQEWAVWEFIESRNLSYPSLYDEGWSRVGCVICTFICSPNMKMVNRNKAKWPGMYKAFEHAVRKWFHPRKAQG